MCIFCRALSTALRRPFAGASRAPMVRVTTFLAVSAVCAVGLTSLDKVFVSLDESRRPREEERKLNSLASIERQRLLLAKSG